MVPQFTCNPQLLMSAVTTSFVCFRATLSGLTTAIFTGQAHTLLRAVSIGTITKEKNLAIVFQIKNLYTFLANLFKVF